MSHVMISYNKCLYDATWCSKKSFYKLVSRLLISFIHLHNILQTYETFISTHNYQTLTVYRWQNY